MTLHVDRYNFDRHGSPTLVLLHGLGAHAAVWDGMLPFAARWPGRVVVPDLRGHGRSPHAAPYGFATLAADVADLFDQGEAITLIGHSMGGAVAMALASGWFGVSVERVFALGIKLVWSAEDLARAAELARAPVRRFDDRAAAIERHLRVAGLAGLVDPASAAAAVGIAADDGGFRLAADPRVHGVAGPAIDGLVAAMLAPLRLAAGEADPMASAADMRRCDPQAEVLEGLGHNAHVEAPERVWRLFERFAANR